MPEKASFSPDLFRFLKSVKRHNTREWFLAHKPQYERDVRDPALRFIADFGARLQRVAPQFVAIPKPVGGSLFRIHRDVRFAADKRPYKTHVGIYFPHRQVGRDVHAPVFYLHLEPDGCFAGAGLWHPGTPALGAVRDAIVSRPGEWRRVLRAVTLSDEDRLARPPRGYDPSHPFVEDLKRKDFLAVAMLPEARVCRAGFVDDFADVCGGMRPLVEFLTKAVGLPF
ncbi:MAG: DUF2461 domain-containing protein [Gemmatimonadetes bacterium]|nr:DUF2461 domain-containing protein [Gemmatimonadota bacterium]